MNRQPHAPTKAKVSRALGNPDRFQMPPKHPPCGRRRCETYDHALQYLLWIAPMAKDPLRIQDCPDCAGFHLTKRPAEDPS